MVKSRTAIRSEEVRTGGEHVLFVEESGEIIKEDGNVSGRLNGKEYTGKWGGQFYGNGSALLMGFLKP